jgi:hypothetical protein
VASIGVETYRCKNRKREEERKVEEETGGEERSLLVAELNGSI